MKQTLVDQVWDRSHNRCEYCLFPALHAWLPFQVDHIIAEKHGGQTLADNLALSCYYCNSFKGPSIAGSIRMGLLSWPCNCFIRVSRSGLSTSNGMERC